MDWSPRISSRGYPRGWHRPMAMGMSAPGIAVLTTPTPPPTAVDYGGYRPQLFGYGMNTPGGRGGTIYRINSLADTGAGRTAVGDGSYRCQLRYALETATEPRIVVFEVSGYFDLANTIIISNPYITIAAQTAPSPGVPTRKYGFDITTHDVAIQHFQMRMGYEAIGKESNANIIFYGTQCHGHILDHVSISWGIDEGIAHDTYYSGDMNCLTWRSISSEGLDFTPDSPFASHGYLVMDPCKKVALVQSVLACNRERNPYVQANSSIAAINSVIYNWFGPWGFFFNNFNISANPGGTPWQATVMGNLMIPGPNTDDDSTAPQGWMFYYDDQGAPSGNQIYRADNTLDNTLGITMTIQGNEMGYDPNVGAPPANAPINSTLFPYVMSSSSIQGVILDNAGARPLNPDGYDVRIKNHIINRTSDGYINDQNDIGGYPGLSVVSAPLTLPANPHNPSSVRAVGTVIEDWLELFCTTAVDANHPQLEPIVTGRQAPTRAAKG